MPFFFSVCTHTHLFNGSGTTWLSQYQKGKTNLDFTEARDSEWQWHQLGHMQVYISLQTDNHASTPPLSFLQAGVPFLPPNQQRQSTEGTSLYLCLISDQCSVCLRFCAFLRTSCVPMHLMMTMMATVVWLCVGRVTKFHHATMLSSSSCWTNLPSFQSCCVH